MAVTINGTTGVAVPLGTAAAPGVVNTTSATTGIYNPTSTTLGLSTNGTQAVYVDASQNVGIGTTSTGAGYRVSVAGSAASSVPLYLHSDATNGYVYSPNPLVVGSTGAYALSLVTNNTTQMTIASSGIITGTAGNLMLVSGTAISSPFSPAIGPEFTGIPSWVKRITLMCSSLSPSSTANMLIQLGSTTYTTTGYRGVCQGWGPASSNCTSFTTGFGITNGTGTAADSMNGLFTISLLGSNIWTCSGSVGRDNTNVGTATAGAVTLGGTLDRIRFYIDGTATFDAGTINIQYE